MKTITLDELTTGFKFKLDNLPDSLFIKLDIDTTPTAHEFYENGDILCAEINCGAVFKMEKDLEISYFYRDYVK